MMFPVPAVAISAAVTAIVNVVELTNVVARAIPFHRATVLDVKFVPVSVTATAAPPAVAPVGLMTLSVGAGVKAA